MRKRAKRDLTILLGIVLAAGVLLFINYEFNRGELIEYYTKVRASVEEKRLAKGQQLLNWRLITGTPWGRSGPEFRDELLALNETPVDIIGFMTPIDRFRNMTEFILLPLPIECYFCQMPPRDHVVLVTMADGATTDRYKEPVLISGRLELQEGRDARFFYKVVNATVEAGEEGATLTRWRMDPKHMDPEHMQVKEEPQLEAPLPVP